MRQIGNVEKQRPLSGLGLPRVFFELRHFLTHLSYCSLVACGLLTSRTFRSDFFREAFSFRLELLKPSLRSAPFPIAFDHIIHGFHELWITRGQPLLHEIGLVANEPDIEH